MRKGVEPLRYTVYQKMSQTVNADIIFSIFKAELPYFLEGAGHPKEHRARYFSHYSDSVISGCKPMHTSTQAGTSHTS